MKKIYSFTLALIAFISTHAQDAQAVVFSEMGDKFTLYLNGSQINAVPQSNVKAEGLVGEFFQARVDFEDPTKGDFAENNFRVTQNMVVTYMIKFNKKGEYKLGFAGEAEITNPASGVSGASKPNDDVRRAAMVDDEVEIQNKKVVVEEPKTTTVTVVEETKDNRAVPKSGEKVDINMNVGGINMGINMNVEGMETDDAEDKVVTKTTTTTTTTTKSSNSTPAYVPVTPRNETIAEVKSTNSCSKPMAETSFAAAKKNISDKGFDDTRLSTAQSIIKANCMTSAQIKLVCDIFGFEDSKLEFAKYAYDFCYDKESYFVVNETFGFSESTEQLNTYISTK